MPAVLHGVSSHVTTDASSYSTTSFTPAANDLLIAFVVAPATVAAGTFSDSLGGTWSKVTSRTKASGADTIYCFVRDTLVSATSMTATFDCTGDGATGCSLQVARVSGMLFAGLTAIRQSSGENNGSAGATPAPAFAVACLTGSPTLCVIGNGSNPVGTTVPTGWTQLNIGANNNPTKGAQDASRDSGFTGTTITWASTSATAFGTVIVELETAFTGTGAALLTSPTASAAGDHGVAGTAAGTIASPTGSAVGLAAVIGTAAATASSPTASAIGDHGVAATAAATLSSPTGAAVGEFVSGGEVTGTAAALLTSPTASSAGDHGCVGTATATDTATTGAAGGLSTVTGTAESLLGSPTAAAVGNTPASEIVDVVGGGGGGSWVAALPKVSQKPARKREKKIALPPLPVEGIAAGRVPAPIGEGRGRVPWPRVASARATLSVVAAGDGQVHRPIFGLSDGHVSLTASATGQTGPSGSAASELVLEAHSAGETYPLVAGGGVVALALEGRGEANHGTAGGALVELRLQGSAHGVYRGDIREDREIEALAMALDWIEHEERMRTRRRAA
jgi:hypothetical protein